MFEEKKTKVFGEVRKCLDRCIGTDNPLVQATDYIDHLRRDRQWSPQEADEVESLVMRAMRVIVRQPRNGCCQNPARD